MLKAIFSISLLIFLMTLFSCKDNSQTPVNVDECLTMKASSTGTPIDGQYIVAFSNDSHTGGRSIQIAARTLEKHNLSDKVIETIEGEFSNYVMHLTKAEAAALKNEAAVAIVEPDRIISICGCLTVVAPSLVTWNVDHVGYGDGTGKTAWILDSGIDLTHPDLNVDQARSQSFIDGETSGADKNGHGTHVAGIIGAKNNDIGTLGVASGASLVSLKILDDKGEGKLSTALKALTHVKNNGKAGDVANISMTLEEISDILDTEIQAVGNKGIFVTIAAGNGGKSADNFSPAHASGPNIFTVSAVDSLNRFAAFSNYGNTIDYAAPGVRILSTYKNGGYAIISGTSMASPHVAGLLLITNGKIKTEGYATGDPDGSPDPLAHK